MIKTAIRYNYAMIGVSTPDGNWSFGNDGVSNDKNPMPCSESDSKDIPYFAAIFDLIEKSSSMDSTKVYTSGFS